MTYSECGVWAGTSSCRERDRELLAWCGEQYTIRTDLLAVLLAPTVTTRRRRPAAASWPEW
jgi:hypothetical protein